MVRLRPGSRAVTTHSESNERPSSLTSWWKVCPGAVSRSGASRTATVLCENSGRRRTSSNTAHTAPAGRSISTLCWMVGTDYV